MTKDELLRELSYAAVWAFDCPSEIKETLDLPDSWYRLAVLAMMRDLTDRRGIKHPLQEMLLDCRKMAVSTMTIRLRMDIAGIRTGLTTDSANTKWSELVINMLDELKAFSPGFAVELDRVDSDVYNDELLPELAALIKGAFLNWPMDWRLAHNENAEMYESHQKYLAAYPTQGES